MTDEQIAAIRARNEEEREYLESYPHDYAERKQRVADIDALLAIIEELTVVPAHCGDPAHEWHVAGDAYTNCCDQYIDRQPIERLLDILGRSGMNSE